MKSVFNKIEKEKSKEIKFPVLAESNRNGFVVMFLGYRKGIVVKGNPENPVGHYSESYFNVDDKTRWRILSPEESIVLSNDWYLS